MISGFNTDIEFDKVVYHVQTEDKGQKTRLVLSLVYDKGTILASKRVSYDELLDGEFDEKVLAEKMQRQHQLICAAVKQGRVGDLKEMTAKKRNRPDTSKKASTISTLEPQLAVTVATDAPAAVPQTHSASRPDPSNDLQPPKPHRLFDEPDYPMPQPGIEEPLIEGVSIIEDDEILPADAVAVVSEFSGLERPSHTKLSIELVGDSKFRGGDRRTVTFMVCRGTDRKVIPNAEIMVKVLGSSFRPVIFHAKSDANGLAKAHLQLPHFDAGRAALLVRAMNDGEEVELRRIVSPG